jgi:hypothetical protein
MAYSYSAGDIMKKIILIAITLVTLMLLTGCADFFSAQFEATENLASGEEPEQGEVLAAGDFNYCILEDQDIACDVVELTTTTVYMELEVADSDIATLDSIVFELPDPAYHCTASTENGLMWSDDAEMYYVQFATADAEEGCDYLSNYVGQDTVLAFQLSLTRDDGSSETLSGSAEDLVEESQ